MAKICQSLIVLGIIRHSRIELKNQSSSSRFSYLNLLWFHIPFFCENLRFLSLYQSTKTVMWYLLLSWSNSSPQTYVNLREYDGSLYANVDKQDGLWAEKHKQTNSNWTSELKIKFLNSQHSGSFSGFFNFFSTTFLIFTNQNWNNLLLKCWSCSRSSHLLSPPLIFGKPNRVVAN